MCRFSHRHHALVDVDVEHEPIERRAAGAEIAVAGQRPPFQPAQQLLHVDAEKRAVTCIQARGPWSVCVKAQTEPPDPADVEHEHAVALELVQAEDVAEAIGKVDLGELHVRGDVDAVVVAAEPERAGGDAAKGLRFADGHVQLAAARSGRDHSAAQPRVCDLDARGRQPQIEIEVGKPSSAIGNRSQVRSLVAIKRAPCR